MVDLEGGGGGVVVEGVRKCPTLNKCGLLMVMVEGIFTAAGKISSSFCRCL